MLKQLLSLILRKLHLSLLADKVKFRISRYKNSSDNRRFKVEFPHVVLPPEFILYESFGSLNYRRYYVNGEKSAAALISYFEKYTSLENVRICEWGCGPGRIIRHFPDLLKGRNCDVFGTDYNVETIEWNKLNLEGVNFKVNDLNPPLPFPDNNFDITYCISVFTHLSEELHYEWFKELVRVTKQGGIIFISVHGNAFINKLLPHEKALYEEGKLVVRKTQVEGNRTYTAFQSPLFMKKMMGNNELLEHVERSNDQDFWIIRKK